MRRLMRAAITVLVLHTEDVTQGTAPEIHSGNKWIPREAFTTERQYQSSKPEISAGSQHKAALQNAPARLSWTDMA